MWVDRSAFKYKAVFRGDGSPLLNDRDQVGSAIEKMGYEIKRGVTQSNPEDFYITFFSDREIDKKHMQNPIKTPKGEWQLEPLPNG